MGHAVGGHQQPSIPAMEREGAPTGRHALGPHVVGMRVVVRRVLPGETGPTGGPAMTDVLGVCEAWGDGVATLRRDDGTVVEIATRDIVSGKPVPPRPSARMRVTPREAEGHAAPLWPQVERVALGEWELRTDPAPVDRLRKRANSCLAMGEPDRPFDAAAEAIRSFYATRDREALVQVLVTSAEEEAFRAAGWRLVVPGEAELRLASLATTRRGLPRGDDAELTEDGPRVRAVVGHSRGDAALDGSLARRARHGRPTRRTDGRGWPAGCWPRSPSGGPSRARPRCGCTWRPTTCRPSRCTRVSGCGPTTSAATTRLRESGRRAHHGVG